jgi:D-serine deaminase-like pyridoxal phosphate-dependent protein
MSPTTSVDPATVETPVGFVDLERVRANASRVAEYAARHGLAWRPHIKTHKSTVIARIQLDAGARGLTVATPREAEVMAAVTPDLVLAYPPVGASKLDRLTRLPDEVDLKISLDDVDVLRPLAGAARAAGRTFGILAELDAGLRRVGVQSPEALVRLASEAAELEGVDFRGILFYPGHLRMAQEEQASGLAEVARRVRAGVDALGDAGLPPGIVSGGSTPTLWHSHLIDALTEIRSGSSIFFDREGVEVGTAELDDVAYTVLTTVVSTAVPGRAVVDAGSKALSKEERGGQGYGFLVDRPEVRVVALSEEHGILDVSGSDWRPHVGERVRIVPNHVCVSVNLQDALLARDGEGHTILELEGRGRGPWTL